MLENMYTWQELNNLASSGRMDTPIWVQFVSSCDTYVAVPDWNPKNNFIAVLGCDWKELSRRYGVKWIAWKLPPTAQEKADALLMAFERK